MKVGMAMSRGIRMKVYPSKKMKAEHQNQSVHHSQSERQRKQQLIREHQRKQEVVRIDKKSKQADNKEVRRLRQRIQRLEKEQQQSINAAQRKLKESEKRVQQLRQANHHLRQEQAMERLKIQEKADHLDQKASKLLASYVEISAWLRTFDELAVKPFAGKSIRDQLLMQRAEDHRAYLTMVKLLQLSWQEVDSVKARARQYDRLQNRYHHLQQQQERLADRYQQCDQDKNELKKRLRRSKRDFNIAQAQMLKRYVNGSQLNNAFHVLTDQLSTETIHQYGPLIPLLEKVVDTFNRAVKEKRSTNFIYGYLIEKNGQFYVSGNREGSHPLIITGLSKSILATIKPGVAIKVQRVDREHYYLVTTMPWVNEVMSYLEEQGSMQPNRLVRTSGTVSLNRLLASHLPTPPSSQTTSAKRVILGKAIRVQSQAATFACSQVVPVVDQQQLAAASERVMIVNPNKLVWLANQKVLLLGNKKISPLVDQLRKYVELTVMDAYEDSLALIFKRMTASDFIFILLGSVPHAVTDYLKQHSELDTKVQRFYRADANEGVRRLNYLYENRREEI